MTTCPWNWTHFSTGCGSKMVQCSRLGHSTGSFGGSRAVWTPGNLQRCPLLRTADICSRQQWLLNPLAYLSLLREKSLLIPSWSWLAHGAVETCCFLPFFVWHLGFFALWGFCYFFGSRTPLVTFTKMFLVAYCFGSLWGTWALRAFSLSSCWCLRNLSMFLFS
jgi:hypothetical protein